MVIRRVLSRNTLKGCIFILGGDKASPLVGGLLEDRDDSSSGSMASPCLHADDFPVKALPIVISSRVNLLTIMMIEERLAPGEENR